MLLLSSTLVLIVTEALFFFFLSILMKSQCELILWHLQSMAFYRERSMEVLTTQQWNLLALFALVSDILSFSRFQMFSLAMSLQGGLAICVYEWWMFLA